MATTTGRLFSLEDVRASVKRVQSEGERLVGRLRRDARALVERNARPAVDRVLELAPVRRLRADVRARAERAVRDLEARRSRVRATVEERLTRVSEVIVRRLNVVTRTELAQVTRRLGEIERRLEALVKAAEDRAA